MKSGLEVEGAVAGGVDRLAGAPVEAVIDVDQSIIVVHESPSDDTILRRRDLLEVADFDQSIAITVFRQILM